MADVNGVVAVAIDKDKMSRFAVQWAIENLVGGGGSIVLIHVIIDSSAISDTSQHGQHVQKKIRELFLTFHCFCTRKDVHCLDITLKDTNVAKALIEYARYAAIEHLVLGASRGGLIRIIKQNDIPATVSKGAPDFCNVYVISKTKNSTRYASRPVPSPSFLQSQLDNISKETPNVVVLDLPPPTRSLSSIEVRPFQKPVRDDQDIGRSGKINDRLSLSDITEGDRSISFVSSDRTSIEPLSPMHYDYMDPRLSTSSDQSFGSLHLAQKATGTIPFHDYNSFMSQESGRISNASSQQEDVENEMRRLKLELKQTMQMYSDACKDAAISKERSRQRSMEFHQWRLEEDKKLLASEEAALMRDKSWRGDKSLDREKVVRIHEENTEELSTYNPVSYRKYSIEEIETATENFSESLKLGEGGYGPVYKCYLDYTKAAVKVLSSDAAQGMTQFQKEVEILSCIRHPHMVLLLGACPEYGCLVYEYMPNGSLDDCLFCRGKTPPLPWQVRFRIAAEVASGLHFLHQRKPEPLVHRDFKPGNILLGRYFVSKIGDVGLARLVPPTVADQITKYHMTSAAGTFCYIDPEYQLTGMLGVKSDVYSLGVVLLQILTARPPMGLTHQVSCSIEQGTFHEVLDPLVPDWPIEEALGLAKLAIRCAEMRRKDRPELGDDILPELNRLRDFADDRTPPVMFYATTGTLPVHSQTPISQETISDPVIGHSVASSENTPSSSSLPPGETE